MTVAQESGVESLGLTRLPGAHMEVEVRRVLIFAGVGSDVTAAFGGTDALGHFANRIDQVQD